MTSSDIGNVAPGSVIETVASEPSLVPYHSSMFALSVELAARSQVAPAPVTLASALCGFPPIMTKTSPTAGRAGNVADSASAFGEYAVVCWTSDTGSSTHVFVTREHVSGTGHRLSVAQPAPCVGSDP